MYHVLDMPWGVRYPHVSYRSGAKINVYQCDGPLPEALRPYASADFSYQRWHEDTLNHTIAPHAVPTTTFTPRPHQVEAGAAITVSYLRGWRGFLEADKTGLGKTLSVLVGITECARRSGFTPERPATVIIACPKAVIPHWRNTLTAFSPTDCLRPLIITYQQLGKLIEPGADASAAKRRHTKLVRTARHGTPRIDAHFVIFDEAHYLKNFPKSVMSIEASTVAQLEGPYVRGNSPFVVFTTATPGATPLNLSCMAGIIAPLIDPVRGAHTTPRTWGPFLHDTGFAVSQSKTSKEWSWVSRPWFTQQDTDEAAVKQAAVDATRRHDTARIGRALTTPGAPFLMRSPTDIAGWPAQQFIPTPLDMTAEQMVSYHEAWTRFRAFLQLPAQSQDPKIALVERLRYRQKSSLLKVPTMVDLVSDMVDAGNQVYVSCEFLDTVRTYMQRLGKKHITYTLFTGKQNDTDREVNRLAFQRGMAQVILCTSVAGISLQSRETLPDGSHATSVPRVTVLHDVRQNPQDSLQACGRAHRDGENSIVYLPYLGDTVDETVIGAFVAKVGSMGSMTGQDDPDFLDRLFRAASNTFNIRQSAA